MNRLMLCAGTTKREGWKTLDCNGIHMPDYIATLPAIPDTVRKVEWDEIELIHGITSFHLWEAWQLLREIHLCLAVGGKLVLEQPNLEYILAFNRPVRLEWLFGDPLLKNPAHMNKWAYSPSSLGAMLTKCGYQDLAFKEAQHHNLLRDFRVEAYK